MLRPTLRSTIRSRSRPAYALLALLWLAFPLGPNTAVAAAADVPPVLTVPPGVAGAEGALIQFDVYADDPDGDPIDFLGICTGPPNVCLSCFVPDPGNRHGVFSWTPGFNEAGAYGVCFEARSTTLAATATTTITVVNTDRAPVVTAPATIAGDVNFLLQFVVLAGDPDGDAIVSLGAAPLPTGATFSTNASFTSGTFSWIPSFTQEGAWTITFTASNALAGTANTAIYVGGPDRAPVVIAPLSVGGSETVLLSFMVTAGDPDGDAIVSLTANLSALPPGNDATFATNATNTQGTFAWTPAAGMEGTFNVTFIAVNTLTGLATTTITVTSGPDRPPVVTAPVTVSVDEDVLLAFDVAASDPDGGLLALSALGLPTGATFTDHGNNTGTFAWTPDFSQAGSYSVTFRATDPQGLYGQAATGIRVNNTNQPPVAEAGGPYFGLQFFPVLLDGTRSSDPDGDLLTYSWDFGDGTTGAGSTPAHTYTGAGNYYPTLTVADPQGLTDTDSATVTVGSVCHAQVFTLSPYRAIRLGSGKPTWCAQFEPDQPGCFPVDLIDLSSITMVWPGGGPTEIHAIEEKSIVAVNRDRDGILEIEACFAKDDLRTLFASLPPGENRVTVDILARTTTAPLIGLVVGSLGISVFETGGALAARIAPSPLRGSAEISFVTRQPGAARVRLFDLNGRLVRTLMEESSAPAGSHVVPFDGRGNDGAPLAGGVYFFRIEADRTEQTGRLVVTR